MASCGSGKNNPSRGTAGGRQADVDPDVEAMLDNLHLTAEEGEVAAWSDDEDDTSQEPEIALIGKVLSPMVMHARTILGAMKPAWE